MRALLNTLFPLRQIPLASRSTYREALSYAQHALEQGRIVITPQNGCWQVSRVTR